MSIADRIEAAVGDILPVYGYTPEFTAEDEPQKYAVYQLTEKGAEYGEGEHKTEQFFVSLNVFTPRLDFELYERLKQAMYAAGFSYDSGGSTGTDRIYPYTTHYYLDFSGVECRE